MDDLFGYQEQSALVMAARPAAVLGDPPGTGKTRTMLAASLFAGCFNPTVVSPANARKSWREESKLLGLDIEHITYDTLVRRGGMKASTDVLLVDEVHKLKNPASARTGYVLGNHGLWRQHERVYVSSGTFMPKNPLDLWPVLSRLFPARLLALGIKHQYQFTEHFCITQPRWFRGGMEEKVVGVKNVEVLRALLADVMVLSDLTIDLPPLHIVPWEIDVPYTSSDPEVQAVLDRVHSGEITLEAAMHDEHMAREESRFGAFIGPIVGDMLVEQMEESPEPIVVAAHNTEVLDGLHRQFLDAGIATLRMDGRTVEIHRSELVDQFQRGEAQCLLVQGTVAQESWTLTAARRVVSVQPRWTYTDNLQLGKRVSRIGQQAATCIMQLVRVKGTISEAIVRQHENERRMQEQVWGLGNGATPR